MSYDEEHALDGERFQAAHGAAGRALERAHRAIDWLKRNTVALPGKGDVAEEQWRNASLALDNAQNTLTEMHRAASEL